VKLDNVTLYDATTGERVCELGSVDNVELKYTPEKGDGECILGKVVDGGVITPQTTPPPSCPTHGQV
jgi:hypothetical protein